MTKEKAPELRRRKGRVKKIKVTVFGFKIWVVWDPNSGLPIAMRFATIEVADITLAKEVIEQAITNLGEHARIVSIAMDRGFMDGKLLCGSIERESFFISGKSNQHVYDDAISLVETGLRDTRETGRKRGMARTANKSSMPGTL